LEAMIDTSPCAENILLSIFGKANRCKTDNGL